MAISTNGAIITRLAGALYNEYLSNASYLEVSTTAPATVAANFLSNDFAGKTDAQLATTILTNLGLTTVAGLDNWVAAQLTAAGTTAAAKGAALVSMLNSYAGMTADATYGASATSFNAKVTASLKLSQTDASAGGSFGTSDAVAAVGGTTELTTGVDSVVGTAYADVIDGTSDGAAFSSADRIDGGAGVDRLVVQGISSLTTTSNTVKNIEEIEIYNLVDDGNVNFTNTSGITSVTLANKVGDAHTITGLAAGTLSTISLVGNTTVGTDDVQTVTVSGLSGSADALTIKVDGVGDTNTTLNTDADTVNINPVSGANGYETLNFVTEGIASFVTINDGDSTTLTTINSSGTAALALEVTPTTVTTVNASTMTGAFTVTVGAGALAITGGSGSDNINMAGTYGTTDTIDGGSGTDTLWLTSVEASASTSQTSRITSIEKIRITDEHELTTDLSKWGATGVIETAAGHAADAVIQYSAGAGTLEIGAIDEEETTLTVRGNLSSDADTLTVTLGSSSTAVTDYGTIASTNFETINIVTQGGAVTGDAVSMSPAAATILNISGTFGGTFGTLTAASINASALALTAVTATGVTLTAGTAARVTGSSGVDVITGSAGADVLIGGSGADTLDANAGNDVLNGGAGADLYHMDALTTIANGAAVTVISDAAGSYSTSAAATTYLDTLTLEDGAAEATYTVTLNTGVSASTVVVAATVSIGTTTVAAGGFLVVSAGDAEEIDDARIYQDTDGDGVIEAGEYSLAVNQIDPTAADVAVTIVGNALTFTVTDR